MKRYLGENLPSGPKIALVTNDNLGNFVIATPLMQMLRERHGGTLDYYGGTRVAELAKNSDLVTSFVPLHGTRPRELAREMSGEIYDLVVNLEWTTWAKAATSILAGPDTLVCGPCVGADGRGDLPFPEDERGRLWLDQAWVSPHIRDTYPFLESGHIAEIFCRLAYLDGKVPQYRLPVAEPGPDLPDVWMSATASLPDKLWPLEKWMSVLKSLRAQSLRVGLLGAKPSEQTKFWKGGSDEDKLVEAGLEDYRGKFTLPQVVGAIGAAKLVVTLDNGILHLASATETKIVGLFREGIHRLWAPPNPHLTVLHPAPDAKVAEIPAESVISAAKI